VTEPLRVLHEAAGLAAFPLPEPLAERYGGTLGFDGSPLISNFVSTVDGVVAIPDVPASPKVLGDASDADRFVMGLLRACAGALLMGASTFRASSEARWTAASLYPAAADDFAELRRRIGLDPEPGLAVVTMGGVLDVGHPALAAGTLVVTTERGAARLRDSLPAASELLVAERDGSVDLPAVVAELRQRAPGAILSEGGPTMLGSLLDAGLLDELFLTVSPLLAGRPPDDERSGLVEGVALLPDRHAAGRLLGIRLDGDHLFLRYGVRPA
jgi:riboflavin biosynthesis pyrimidine reductase